MKLKNHHGKSTFGMPSVILILLVLTLTIFSLLALRSSVNERKLAEKTAEAAGDYYSLEGAASYLLKDLANLDAKDGEDFCNKAQKIAGVTSASFTGNNADVSYSCQSSPKSTSGIRVRVLIDLKTRSLDILEWKMYHTDDSSYDFNLPD